MSPDAMRRAKILEMINDKRMTQADAAEKLKLSIRQVKRLFKKYKVSGDESLNHGLTGRPGNHRKQELKEKVLDIVREKFKDFKPLFISEKLAVDYKIQVQNNTLRLWMMEAGLWEKRTIRAKHRQRRPRRPCFGEMLQIDGSPHDWLSNGRELCLLHIVDDATGTAYGLFDSGETTEITLRVLKDWICLYGIPQIIYSDNGGVFRINRELTIDEQLQGIKPLTVFGKVCDKLGIEQIFAGSPQAKGRVERYNGVQQDKLVSELRYRGITDPVEANIFLKEVYWPAYNKRYSKKPASDNDMHIRVNSSVNLDELICFEIEKKISNDFVIRYENILYQILKTKDLYLKPGVKVCLQIWLDGSRHIFYRDRELNFKILNPDKDLLSA